MPVIKLLCLLLLFVSPARADELKNGHPTMPIYGENKTGCTIDDKTSDTNSSKEDNFASNLFFNANSNSSSKIFAAGNETSTVKQHQNGTPEIPNDKNMFSNNQTQQFYSQSGVPAISLSEMNLLRALIETRQLQVALAKEEKKLLELTNPPPVQTKALIKKTTPQKKKRRPVWPQIVSIQGIDGRLSATLSSSAGLETVTEGRNAGPGKVISITPSRVLIRFNGKNVPLKFKE